MEGGGMLNSRNSSSSINSERNIKSILRHRIGTNFMVILKSQFTKLGSKDASFSHRMKPFFYTSPKLLLPYATPRDIDLLVIKLSWRSTVSQHGLCCCRRSRSTTALRITAFAMMCVIGSVIVSFRMLLVRWFIRLLESSIRYESLLSLLNGGQLHTMLSLPWDY